MFVTEAPYSSARLEDYGSLIGDGAVDDIRNRAQRLAGLRVLHINATLTGGGVAEILYGMIPLMRDAGIEADWYVLEADDEFFEVTKSIHNAFQGSGPRWRRRYFEIYRQGNAHNATKIARRLAEYDVVIVHDPQPLALRSLLPDHEGRWIWRCHIDLTAPSRPWWRAFAPFLAGYDLGVFSTPEFVPPSLTLPIRIALPCIDAFRAKNTPLDEREVLAVQQRYGVDPERPIMLQVSRYDPWKDPLGVIEAYRRAKAEREDLQLVYMASMAADDPEGWRIYEQVRDAAGDDPDVHLLALDVPPGEVERNAREVNAMQRGADVILQKSIREGFGLTVTEGLWKGRAVVAGDVGGIRHQIRDGYNGYLVSDVPTCASRVLELLADPGLAQTLGERGRETVREGFLMTRLLGQYLEWFEYVRSEPSRFGNGNGAR